MSIKEIYLTSHLLQLAVLDWPPGPWPGWEHLIAIARGEKGHPVKVLSRSNHHPHLSHAPLPDDILLSLPQTWFCQSLTSFWFPRPCNWTQFPQPLFWVILKDRKHVYVRVDRWPFGHCSKVSLHLSLLCPGCKALSIPSLLICIGHQCQVTSLQWGLGLPGTRYLLCHSPAVLLHRSLQANACNTAPTPCRPHRVKVKLSTARRMALNYFPILPRE